MYVYKNFIRLEQNRTEANPFWIVVCGSERMDGDEMGSEEVAFQRERERGNGVGGDGWVLSGEEKALSASCSHVTGMICFKIYRLIRNGAVCVWLVFKLIHLQIAIMSMWANLVLKKLFSAPRTMQANVGENYWVLWNGPGGFVVYRDGTPSRFIQAVYFDNLRFR